MSTTVLTELLERTSHTLDDPGARRAATAATVEFLLSQTGLELIHSQIRSCGIRGTRTIEGWTRDLAATRDDLDDATREKLGHLVEAIVGEPSTIEMGDEEVDVQEIARAIGKAAAGFAARGGAMPQWLEAIDDAFGIENVVRDGTVALVVTLALSSAMNSRRYHQGKIRWDDALDSVAGDVIKATITGLIVSAAVTPLGPAGLAAAVPIGLIVYTAVSAVCDAIYDRLLGGSLIVEARRLHGDYVEVSQHIRAVLYPRMEKLDALGGLVEFLGRAAASPDLTSDLLDEALELFATMKGRDQLLGTGDAERAAGERTWLAAHLLRQGVREEWGPAEVERIAGGVHRVYWSIEPHLPRTKIPVDLVERALDRPDEPVARREDRQRLVRYLVEVERTRPSVDAPVSFRLKVDHSKEQPRLPRAVMASDVVELARFVHTATEATWAPTLTKPGRIQVVKASAKKRESDEEAVRKRLSRGGTSAANWAKAEEEVLEPYRSWDTPLDHECANPLYRSGFLREVASGEWRLFRMNLARGPAPKYGYVAIPATGDELRMRQSLSESHPYFRSRGGTVATLEEVAWADQTAEEYGVFTGMGWRCAPLQLYTATYRFQETDGSVSQLSQEGYFASLEEAYFGFATKLDHHLLIGVRPGGLLLSESLRERLAQAPREEFWSLQRALISRISGGLLLLDELAGRAERRIALMAGGGVLVGTWWFVSSRSRRELLGVMHNEGVRQALRYEMMEALIELQRVHNLSHRLFDGDPAGSAETRLAEIALDGASAERRGIHELSAG